MLLKPLVGTRFLNEDAAMTKGTIWDVTVFLGRETELCQNCYGFRVPVKVAGTKGSTIILLQKNEHSTTTTIISQGGDPPCLALGYLTASRALRASPENVRPIPVLGCPTPRFPPYSVRTRQVHGAPAYGRRSPPEARM